MSLWKVQGTNSEGKWTMFVRCSDPFDAMRRATEEKSWSVLDKLSITAVLNFAEEPDAPSAA